MTTKNIGFIATRLQGTDGVSLETQKWSTVLERMGYHTYFFAGLSDWDSGRTMVVPEGFFGHPEIKAIQDQCFGRTTRSRSLTNNIHKVKENLKQAIYTFIEHYKIDLIIPENVLAIPMNLPLGLAITELIAETGIPTIAHHHDLFWERNRFLTSGVADILASTFPPPLSSIRHVVINSLAAREFSYRTGYAASVIPNVLEFEAPPPEKDNYNKDLRADLGVEEDALLVLQPTRIVPRKRIERAIEIVARLKNPKAKLVISHASGDEGPEYQCYLQHYTEAWNVPLIIGSNIIDTSRGLTANGRKIYTLWDVYPHSDLVMYPSEIEGAGNAFFESVWFRKPIVVNEYPVFKADIAPLGFDVIKIDGFVTEKAIRQIQEVLTSPDRRAEMTEKNYQLASQHFSYAVLAQKLLQLL